MKRILIFLGLHGRAHQRAERIYLNRYDLVE